MCKATSYHHIITILYYYMKIMSAVTHHLVEYIKPKPTFKKNTKS